MEEVEGRKGAEGTTEQSGRESGLWLPAGNHDESNAISGREGGQWGITRVIAHLTQIGPPSNIYFIVKSWSSRLLDYQTRLAPSLSYQTNVLQRPVPRQADTS